MRDGMAKNILLKRGKSVAVAAYTGSPRELVVDAGANTLAVQDGETAGGVPAAKLSDVPVMLSQITDDAGLWRKDALTLASLTDDAGLWKKSELTKLSQLANAPGYKTGHCTYCSHCSYCSNCGRCNNVKCSQAKCNQVQCSQCSGQCTNCSNCSNCRDCDCCDN